MTDNRKKRNYNQMVSGGRRRPARGATGHSPARCVFLLIPFLMICLLLSSCEQLLRMPEPDPPQEQEETRKREPEEETDPDFDDEWDPSEIRDDSGDDDMDDFIDDEGNAGAGGGAGGAASDDVGARLIPDDADIVSEVSGVLVMSSGKSFQSLISFYRSAMNEIGAQDISVVQPVDGLWNYVGSYGSWRTVTINLRDDGSQVHINVTW